MNSTAIPGKRTPRSLAGAICLGLLAATGCGGGTGTITGTVQFKDAPVRAGRVTFVAVTGENTFGDSKSCAILDDGTYTIKNAPTGEVKITVETFLRRTNVHSAMPKDLGKGMVPENSEGFTAPPEKYVKLPDRYSSVQTTELTFKVKSGNQSHDIEMKP